MVSRVVPDLYRSTRMLRLSPFFQTLRVALQAVAPQESDTPRVVLLDPGTHSETAFDQAFLATLLGYPLVEGSDLTVRDGRVWLRALGRLEPVDVILRRVDSSWCDPLELRPGSQLGCARPARGGSPRHRVRRQHRRQRGAGEPGSAAVPPAAGQGSCSTRSCCSQRSTRSGAASRRLVSTCSPTSTAWCCGRCRAARDAADSASS